MKVPVTFFGRLFCVIFTVLGTFFFLTVFSFLVLFLADHEFLDQYNIPRISNNPNFDLNQYFPSKDTTLPRILFNLGLMVTFWVHHIIMANEHFKRFMNSVSNYQVYERGLYIICKINLKIGSDFLLAAFIILWQPIGVENSIFDLRGTPLEVVFFILNLLFSIQFFMTAPFFIQTDLLGWKRMFKVIQNDVLDFDVFTKISIPFIYRACRHPMQGAFIGMFLFSAPVCNLGKVLFLTVFVTGIVLGVHQEEKFLNKIEEYRRYKTIVKNKFFVDIFNAFNPDVKKALYADKTE